MLNKRLSSVLAVALGLTALMPCYGAGIVPYLGSQEGEISVSAKPAPTVHSLPASDSRISYIGRTLVSGDEVSFDWTGVYARLSFTGGYLALKASDTGCDYFNVWIDKEPCAEPDKVICIKSDTLVVLFEAVERKVLDHSLTIQKRTEGRQGKVSFKAFELKGELRQASGYKDRVIEFVGDSYTCGYGSENSVRKDPFRPQDENPSKTYADIICRYFDADAVVVAHSGWGVARNYNSAAEGYYMADRYLQTFDEDKDSRWDASRIKPSLTVIYLGTNDFSTGKQPSLNAFKKQYHKLLGEIKANYGAEHPVVCMGSPSGEELHRYMRIAIESAGLKNVHYVEIGPSTLFRDEDFGASNHPNYRGHLKKAMMVIPTIASVMDWPLEDKVIF